MKKIQFTIAFLLSLSANAISQIEGDVRGKDNKRISKAVVIAVDTTKNIIDSVVTDDHGFYSFETLKPGRYLIEAKAAGFEKKLYQNIIARERLVDPAAGDDISNATRLQIILVPKKTPK